MKSLIGIGAFLFTLILSMGAISSCGGGGDTVTKATVSGTVLDSNGNPIVAALVTITSTPLTTDTDPDGYFSAEVEVGDHTITFSVGSYIVSQYDFTVGDESPVDLGDLEPTNPYYPGGATWYKDIDGDLYSDGTSAQSEIPPLDGYDLAANLTGTTGDCDDSNDPVNPGAAEVCNSIDDNCDGSTDEGLTFDVDTDGFTSIGSCGGSADDCEDSNFAINPGAAEVCNSIDDNCAGGVD
ncbi:carboxypeptidase regulatory-like domain-containing protein, partial [bacterium]|nr:carboxypeptidase regulatory-like domain-containing protein [bacterium]